MTIAIGMLCGGGALIAADTRVAMTDNSATQGNKLIAYKTDWGNYAIANATEDGRAAQTLINRIHRVIKKQTGIDWDKLEDLLSSEMTEWSHGFRNSHPSTELLIAAYMQANGVRLYFCQPPNTVLAYDGYIAIGYGNAVTDPLYQTLFDSTFLSRQDPQRVMRIMAYLTYRAKKNNVLCGDKTHAIYVMENGYAPRWVRSTDFEAAENESPKLDFLLHTTSQFALMSEPGANLQANAAGIGQMLIGLAGLRAVTFCDITGEPIVEATQ